MIIPRFIDLIITSPPFVVKLRWIHLPYLLSLFFSNRRKRKERKEEGCPVGFQTGALIQSVCRFDASVLDQVLALTLLNLEKTSKDVFSSLASGKQRIPLPASVRSGRSPSRSDAKRKRSALDRASGRGITNLSIWSGRIEARASFRVQWMCPLLS